MSAQQKRPTLLIASLALFIAAGVVLCIVRLPFPLRLAVAGTDLIAAAILFAASRQQRAK